MTIPGSHPRRNCSADFRKELGRLSREALFGLLELVDALVERPSAYARLVENIGLALRNANFLLNLLRAHQVPGPSRCILVADSKACDSTRGPVPQTLVYGSRVAHALCGI